MPNSDEYFQDSGDAWSLYVLAPFLVLVIITTIFGNLFVLQDFLKRLWKAPHKVSPTHFFIANLATADFLVGIVVLPFLGVRQVLGEWSFGRGWCVGWTFLHFWLCAASILSTCFVCVDRYVGVRFPLRHKEIFSQRNIVTVLVVLWTFAGIPAFLRTFVWRTETPLGRWRTCDLRQNVGGAVFAAITVLYIPVTVIVVLYTKIYFIAKELMRKKQRREVNGVTGKAETTETSLIVVEELKKKYSSIESKEAEKGDLIHQKTSLIEDAGSGKKGADLSDEERQVRLAKRLFILVGVLVASYFPYFTLILLRATHPEFVSDRVFQGFAWLRYFNSCFNPFIYAYAVPAYRKSLRTSMAKLVSIKWSTIPSSYVP